jgi:hypothetical protein
MRRKTKKKFKKKTHVKGEKNEDQELDAFGRLYRG